MAWLQVWKTLDHRDAPCFYAKSGSTTNANRFSNHKRTWRYDMAIKPLPSAKYLRKRLSYNRHTGELLWKAKEETLKENIHWNTRHAGKSTFTSTVKGYKHGLLDGVSYKAHRIIFKLVHGSDPAHIDHINGDRSDNRLCNLRSVTVAQNNRNMARSVRNTSGHTGVYFHAASKKWTAAIKYKGKLKRLGGFDTIEEAIACRERANKRHRFHPNHGKRLSTSSQSTS
jgi:hypothetical protein